MSTGDAIVPKTTYIFNGVSNPKPVHVLYMHDINHEEKIHEKTGQKVKSAEGGSTVCSIFFDDNTFSIGGAFCNRKDKFSRKVGRGISHNRAMFNKGSGQHVFPIRDAEILKSPSEIKRYINQFIKGIYFFSKQFPTCHNRSLNK